jgi:hypothetical protein
MKPFATDDVRARLTPFTAGLVVRSRSPGLATIWKVLTSC